MIRVFPGSLVLIASALLLGCDDPTPVPLSDAGNTCQPSQQSGIWLLPFSPLRQEIYSKNEATVQAMVTSAGANEQEGSPLAAQEVSFRIITQGGDSSLIQDTVQTDQNGLAAVRFQAGNKAMLYQVEVSLAGTCPTNFTIDVSQAIRQLKVVTPSPFNTFTYSRIPIAVEASTDGFAKLSGEEITFTVELGKSAETTLWTIGGEGGNDTLKLTTNGAGRATVMLVTGSVAIPQLRVVAAMAGTADAFAEIRIAPGSGSPCQNDFDCPLSYTCKEQLCEPPPLIPQAGCSSNEDCITPTICDVPSGTCLEPTGALCDPIEGTGCEAGEICVGGRCAKVPESCQNTTNCPQGWICQNGKCQPGCSTNTGGCTLNSDCLAEEACINCACVLKSDCAIPHDPHRLQGPWKYDSTLHLDDAVSPFLGGILGAAGQLRDLIEGRFDLGIPGWIEDIIGSFLRTLLTSYLPPWAEGLIIALGDINDVVQDMRIYASVLSTPVGDDRYVNSEQWDLVEFKYKGQVITVPPNTIPQIGTVLVPNYGSHEICGQLFIDKHKVRNAVGGLILWFINTAISMGSCSGGSACFGSLEQALQNIVNCQGIAAQLDAYVRSVASWAPSIASALEVACNATKSVLIQTLIQELNSIQTKLSMLEMSGTATIPNPPNDRELKSGKWYGTLGDGVINNNFEGDFSALKN